MSVYSESGSGPHTHDPCDCGVSGHGPAESLAAMVATILADAPRARIIGELPTC
jgi:hypothetical protein